MFPARAQSSPGLATDVIVAADPAETLAPKPLISDILRTRFCIPGSIFLVEGSDGVIPVSRRHRAVRLLLGDGELCIQALLRRELHGFLDSDQVHVGSYVRLNSFEFRSLSSRDGARAARGASPVVFLVVNEMTVVGWNTTIRDLDRSQAQRDTESELPAHKPTTIGKGRHLRVHNTGSEALHREGEELSDVDDGFETMTVSEEQATQRRLQNEATQNSICTAQVDSSALPWTSEDLTKPLKLTSLASIPSLPYKQNWTVNVLAVVASLSEIEPATLPPFKQRTARLVDPSTSKQVLLTVFLEPEAFTPKIGSVVLLLGVKNHRFDGGSLKKYGNEKPKNGSAWWLENPSDLSWCEVARLQRWWRRKEQQVF